MMFGLLADYLHLIPSGRASQLSILYQSAMANFANALARGYR